MESNSQVTEEVKTRRKRVPTAEGKKELKTRIAKNSIHLEFYYENGGEVPQDLMGLYTDPFAATNAMNQYYSNREKLRGKSRANSSII